MLAIVVDQSDTELAYIDSGAPNGPTDYVTIFAIHGTVFTSRESVPYRAHPLSVES